MPAPTADRNCVRHTACLKMDHSTRGYHPEFLLARLQKLQRSGRDDFPGLNFDCLQRSAEPSFRDLTQ